MPTKRIIKTTFQVRRGTSEAWERLNPVLAYGEPGFEKNTSRLKIGNGETPWNELPYIGDNASVSADNKSVTFDAGKLALQGFAAATEGQIPMKQDETLEWIDPISADEVTALFTKKGE